MTFDLNTIFVAAFTMLVVYAAVTDVKGLRIANWTSIALVALFAAYVVAGHLRLGTKPLPVLQHLSVALAVLAVGFAVFAFGYMGAGDIKLMTAVALWAGPGEVISFAFLTALTGAGLALLILSSAFCLNSEATPARISRLVPAWMSQGVIPYGVAISAGALMSVPSQLL